MAVAALGSAAVAPDGPAAGREVVGVATLEAQRGFAQTVFCLPDGRDGSARPDLHPALLRKGREREGAGNAIGGDR